jgi:hypothetical protein
LETSWLSLIADWDTIAPPLIALHFPFVPMLRGFMCVFGSLMFLIPTIYLTSGFLANGLLVSSKTGLEGAHALAQ